MKKLKYLLIVLLGAIFVCALAACGGDDEPTYTVLFDSRGGSEVTGYVLEEGDIVEKPADPTRPNFTFVGWYTDEACTAAYAFGSPMPPADLTLYAKWASQYSCKIEYNSMGGSAVEASIGRVGSAYRMPADPTYTGYRFGGWYTDPGYTKLFTSTVFPGESLTLYARWVGDPNYAYIDFYGNGNRLLRMPVLKGERIQDPALFGSEFVSSGWYTDKALTQAYHFGVAQSDLSLYASYYTDGLKIEGGEVTGYEGRYANVVVPSVYNGQAVTSVGEYAFAENTNILTVDLPDSVTAVKEGAFYRCAYLSSVDLPLSARGSTIGKYAFFECSRLTAYGNITGVEVIPEGLFLGCKKLPAVTLSADAKSVGAQAFADCASLTEIVIPAKVTTMGDGLFDGCASLTKVALPVALASFGDGVFEGCGKLAEITLDRTNKQYSVLDGNLYRRGEESSLELLFYACGTKDEKEFVLPSSVTKICAGAFDRNETLESIVVRDASVQIDCGAFAHIAALTSLTVPALGGEGNGYLAYYFGATAIETAVRSSLYIPDTLRKVTLTGEPTAIGENAFYGAEGLEEVAGLGKIQTIGEYAFASTNLKEFNVPASLTKIDSFAFQDCTSMSRFTVEAGNRSFAEFDGCLYNNDKSQLQIVPATRENIEFASGVTQIANSAFAGSSIKELVVPDTVDYIDYAAFRTCNSIESLTVPFIGHRPDQDGYRYMGYIFGSIITLKPQVDADGNEYNGAELNNASNIPTSLHTVTITKPCTEIPDCAFAYMRGLKQVNFTADSVITRIGDLAFYCDPIESWDFAGVTEIGDYAFRQTSLKEVSLPATLTSFGYASFAMIESLEKITLAEGITKIGPQAFVASGTSNSSALHGVEFHSAYNSELVIPSTVQEIGSDAFNGIGMMFDGTRRNLPNTGFSVRFALNADGASALTKIGNGAFAYAAARTLEIPASVQEIGLQAFVYCDALTKVTFGSAEKTSALNKLGGICFAGCSALTDLTMYVEKLVEMEMYDLSNSQTYTQLVDIFYSASKTFTIHVPQEQVETFQGAEHWSTYAGRISAIA